jgi:hypothetical protein
MRITKQANGSIGAGPKATSRTDLVRDAPTIREDRGEADGWEDVGVVCLRGQARVTRRWVHNRCKGAAAGKQTPPLRSSPCLWMRDAGYSPLPLRLHVWVKGLLQTPLL